MEDRKKIYGIKRDIMFLYAALIVLGMIFIIFPEASTVSISLVVAAALCIWGAARLIGYFRTSRFSIFGSYGLVQGSILMLCGIGIFIKPEILSGVIMTVVGIVLIADGILKIQYAIDLLRIRGELWWVIALAALLMIGAGVVVVLDPFKGAAALMVFTGIFLVVNGACDLASVVYISKKLEKLRRAMEDGDFSVEFVD